MIQHFFQPNLPHQRPNILGPDLPGPNLPQHQKVWGPICHQIGEGPNLPRTKIDLFFFFFLQISVSQPCVYTLMQYTSSSKYIILRLYIFGYSFPEKMFIWHKFKTLFKIPCVEGFIKESIFSGKPTNQVFLRIQTPPLLPLLDNQHLCFHLPQLLAPQVVQQSKQSKGFHPLIQSSDLLVALTSLLH